MIGREIPDPSAAFTEDPYSSGISLSVSTSQLTKNILVTLDFSNSSEAVLQAGMRFASMLHAKLFVAHIFDYSDAGVVEALSNLRQKSKQSLDAIVRRIRQQNIVVEPVMRDGRAAPTILKIIRDKEIDLAILGTRNRTGLERFVFGSVAEAVFRRAPCPLLTIGPEACLQKGVHTQAPFVFATDVNPRFFHAIQSPVFLSKAFGAPLHYIQVLPSSSETHGVPIISEIMTRSMKHLIEENSFHERYVCSIVYSNQISEAIVRYAKDCKAQLIVLGIQRTSAIASHLPPHITYKIIAGAPCPVLTVSL